MSFPIDLSAFKPLPLDPSRTSLTPDERTTLAANVQLCRDVIIFFTATGAAKGLGGHTGGPYDIVPEVLIADGFMRFGAPVVPLYLDEAGHRVAIQYLMSALYGHLPAEQLMKYREADSTLPGHPELGLTPGVGFSSGRLGHMWPFANGIALAHPGKAVFVFGSDGSQQEGNDAEAARLAVGHGLDVKIIVDDNDVTIAGHPSEYMPGFSVAKTLAGHGLSVDEGQGEDLDSLYTRMAKAVTTKGPVALINKRKMAVGIPNIEGAPKAHDVISVDNAVLYLDEHGHADAAAQLKAIEKPKHSVSHRGTSNDKGKNREVFGQVLVDILGKLSDEERARRVKVIDSDLEGSCGLHHIHKAFPDIYVASGIMERGNFSAAAGFGMEKGRQGVFGTFSAFLEMCVSEITMARLNRANVLAHFSHAGVDDMADNTCHFGLNNMFAANGLASEDDTTRLYFPGDQHQMRAVLERVFDDPGLRFVFSNRSALPDLLKVDGSLLHGEGYTFEPGKDELVREGTAGYIVSFGETLYRAMDAVERLREKGIDVGLVNKPTLNVVDEDMMQKIGKGGFVLVAEGFSLTTGLGSRFGSWLLERGLTPRFAHIGTHREGCGGLWQQMVHQGLDPDSIMAKVETLAG
ncbi:MAG: transketolase C-terminal domain-containing protein [Candidatus Binatia bacterium]|nr:transketolase C-terminal domain-containing protein [Candidatus Binatia bacterium]